MRIKTLRFHLTLVTMTTIKNINNSKFWQGCGEKGTLFLTLLLGMEASTTTMETVRRLLKKPTVLKSL
jgi:hypothetical protein